ncbi:galactosyl transferase GMA12/MNN10 family-domain-containing protein [Lipomyces oligophaga]|uniref:galactosyl transferase GMA12/MNN10 family-domain-containing protein n=1 Tax=Lipomyces oligophaga TaxID=45792 RepID=UPI0034CFBB35
MSSFRNKQTQDIAEPIRKSPAPITDSPSSTESDTAHQDLALLTHLERLDAIRNKANDVLEPKGSRIVLLSASDGQGHNGAITDLFKNMKENREEYCAYHGYTYQFINLSKYAPLTRPAVWYKMPAILEAFNLNPSAEWVWWLDTDAIIMTPQIDLASHLLNPESLKARITYGEKIKYPDGSASKFTVPESINTRKIDIILAQDHNGVNAGSILFRRSEWTFQFLNFWQDSQFLSMNFSRMEQDALNYIFMNYPRMQDHFAFVPLRTINAISVGQSGMGWLSGDLVVHFAGCWVTQECDTRWKDFWSRREIAGQPSESVVYFNATEINENRAASLQAANLDSASK